MKATWRGKSTGFESQKMRVSDSWIFSLVIHLFLAKALSISFPIYKNETRVLVYLSYLKLYCEV